MDNAQRRPWRDASTVECSGTFTTGCQPIGRYYSEVRSVWITISRSLRRVTARGAWVVATSILATAAAAQPDPPVPSIFPLTPRWTSTLSAPPSHPPVSDGSYLYVPLREGLLACVFTIDGVVQWVVDQPTDFQPTAGGQLLFVAEGPQVRALWAATGTERWRLDLHAPVSAPVLWDAGWLIVSLANGDILAYASEDGRPVWSQRVASAVLRPTIDRERLLVPQQDGYLSALELTTGRLLWERQLAGTPAAIRALDDRLYVGTTDNFLYAIDLSDGRIRWRWRTGADVIGAPIVTPEAVYFVSLDNQIRALALRTGVQLWKRDLPTRPVSGPIQLGDVLMMPGRAPTLHVYYRKTGEPAGQFPVPTELAAPPLVSRATDAGDVALVILTGEGELVAYASAEPEALEALIYLPGNNPTSVPLEALVHMPGWPASPSADTLIALGGLPGLVDVFVPLTPFTDGPGRHLVPPLSLRLVRLPGHAHGVPRLGPLDFLPGRPAPADGAASPPIP